MPNGGFPVPRRHSRHSRSAAAHPSLALRIRTRRKRRRLDVQLSHGADPATSAELTLRDEQLRSPAVRSQLADALVKTLHEARGPDPFTLKLQPHRREIRACADDLMGLVLRLRDDQPVDIRGAAMTALLLTAGESPLDRDSGVNLRHAVRSARVALDPTAPTEQGLSTAA